MAWLLMKGMTMGRIANITQQAVDNTNYRHVLETGPHMQAVIMHIPPGGEVGSETHDQNDQIMVLVEGRGQAVLNDQVQPFEAGDLVLVPAGTKHNFMAAADAPLKLISIYAPPNHPDGLVQQTKEQADAQGL